MARINNTSGIPASFFLSVDVVDSSDAIFNAAQINGIEVLQITGVLTRHMVITFPPTVGNSLRVQNLTTGPFVLTLTAGGARVALPQGQFINLISDTSNNWYNAAPAQSFPVAPSPGLSQVLSSAFLSEIGVSAPIVAYSAEEAFSDSARGVPCNDGDLVQSLRDMGVAGIHANQATAANRPTWLANAANGVPGIDFSASMTTWMTASVVLAQAAFTAGLTIYTLVPRIPAASTNVLWGIGVNQYGSINGASGVVEIQMPAATFTDLAHDVTDAFGVQVFSWEGATMVNSINGCHKSTPLAGSVPVTGDFILGNYSPHNLAFQGVICKWFVFAGAHTQAQKDAIAGQLNASINLPPMVAGFGDSQMAGQGIGSVDQYVQQAMKILGGVQNQNYIFKNFGVSGKKSGDILGTDFLTPYSSYQYCNTIARGVKNLAILVVGENDLQGSPANAVSNYEANITGIAANLKGLGCTLIGATIPPRSIPADATYEANRAITTTWWLSTGRSVTDGVADIAGNLTIGLAASPGPSNGVGNTWYQNDNTHWTESGHAIVAMLLAGKIGGLLNAYRFVKPSTVATSAAKSQNVAGSADVVLSPSVGAATYLTLTGVIGANINVIAPLVSGKVVTVFNNTTGAFTLTYKSATGTGIVVAIGKKAMLACDGTNWVRLTADI